MKKLREILNNVTVNNIVGDLEISIRNITKDSRMVKEGDVFISIIGNNLDGTTFISDAIKNGAKCIISEKEFEIVNNDITYVFVESSRNSLALISANYYENPSRKLNLIGVTGTNGKTTIVDLLYNLYDSCGIKTGIISTIKIDVGDTTYNPTQTTPDATIINKYLYEMVQNDVRYCFMEVSSHGIDQCRTNGLKFKGGVFTNLTHDHLDYHKNFKNYRDTKKVFFDNISSDGFAITNCDDKNGLYMVQNTNAETYTYSLKSNSNFKAKLLESSFEGMMIKINNSELWCNLVGEFNVYNLLAVYSTAKTLGMPEENLLKGISKLKPVKGRLQFLSNNEKIAIVDYAHTPDALENVITSIKKINSDKNSLITVVGCGGDRDKSKRAIMGNIASSLSTKVVFTSDNPRSENPSQIIDDIMDGVSSENLEKVIRIIDRREAIEMALSMAKKNDIVLVAGKGHESYQEINGIKNNFDDFEVIKNIIS